MRGTRSGIFTLVLALAISWSAITTMSEVLTKAAWFHLTGDEAIHAEVIERLAQTGTYSNWSGEPFVLRLTTGPTVMLPAASIAKTWKIPPSVAGRATSLIYYFGCLLVLVALLRKHLSSSLSPRNIVFTLITLGLFHVQWRGLQDNLYYPFAILGEQAVVFWMLTTLWLWSAGSPLLAGVAAGLALLSKPYLMFFIPVVFAVSFLRPSTREAAVKFLIGACGPWILWICWMGITLGVSETFKLWMSYPAIMKAANGGPIAHESMSTKVLGLLHLLSKKGLFTLILGFWASIALARKNPRGIQPFVAYFWVHFAWWWFFSSQAQARYLLPVFLLACVFNLIALGRLLPRHHTPERETWIKDRLPHSAALATGVWIVLLGVLLSRTIPAWRGIERDPEAFGFPRQLALQKFWRETSQRPEKLFSLAEVGYAHDVDVTLSAPYAIQVTDLKALTSPLASGFKNTWVIVGDYTPNQTAQLISEKCAAVFRLKTKPHGFYRCDSAL